MLLLYLNATSIQRNIINYEVLKSPESCTTEPVGLAVVVGGQGTNVVLPTLVDQDHKDHERDRWHSEMHECYISEAETCAQGLEVCQDYHQQNFSCQCEVEEGI